MPPGIASPDKVETRLGTLKFFDGVPDKASTEKLYDNLDFQRAVQAYLLGLPPVNQLANRRAILQMGPANTTVPIWEKMVDSRPSNSPPTTTRPTPGSGSISARGRWSSKCRPRCSGSSTTCGTTGRLTSALPGLTKARAASTCSCRPATRAMLPEGYHVVRCATFSVWAAWRSFLVNGDPKPGVDLVKKFTKIYPLSASRGNPPALTFVNMSGKPFNMVAPADYSFWEMLNQVVQEEPTDSVDATTLGFWASIGIEKGKPFAPDARMKKILTEAAAVGDATARALAYRSREKDCVLLRQPAVEAGVHRRLQVRVAAGRPEPGCGCHVLLCRHRRDAGHGHEDRRRGLHVSMDGR